MKWKQSLKNSLAFQRKTKAKKAKSIRNTYRKRNLPLAVAKNEAVSNEPKGLQPCFLEEIHIIFPTKPLPFNCLISYI